MTNPRVSLSHAEVLALAEVVCPSLNGAKSYALAAYLEGTADEQDADDAVGQVAAAADALMPDRVSYWENQISASDWSLFTVADERYPSNLRMIPDRPPFLFCRGEMSDADQRAVAVVGTRAPTHDGESLARHLSAALIGDGFTVVSGLAAGIDTAAHSSALDAGGRTLAVYGTGISQVYPAANRDLAARITRSGAVLSQFWPAMKGAQWTFPVRNIVTSGLSLATVVVEAGETSGARQQARRAVEHGKVLLLSELLTQSQQWARDLVESGVASAFRTADEVLERVDPELARDAEFV
jgi:DNA processing protein